MKIDEPVNHLLRKFWPEESQGNRKVWFHSQNLNEDRHGKAKGAPYTGRCWLYSPVGETSFEWSLWAGFCGASAKTRESDGLQLHIALPPVSLWLTLPVPVRRLLKDDGCGGHCFFDVNFIAEAGLLCWQFGGNELGDWSSRTPKWKHGSFNVLDFFLGKQTYAEGTPEIHAVKIPMPEGAYDATVKIHDDCWRRPRWFAKRLRRADVDVPMGIPFQGKGENSWDCGEDRTFGISGPANNPEDAIAMTVRSVFGNRRRYDGNLMAVYPSPHQQQEGADSTRQEAEAGHAEIVRKLQEEMD